MNSRLGTAPIIHIPLCMGLTMSMGAFYFVRSQGGVEAPPEDLIQNYLILGVAMAAMSSVMAFILPGMLLAKVRAIVADEVEPLTYDQLKEYVPKYQTAKIVQWALVEGPGLLNGVFFFLTGHLPFLMIGGAMLLLLVFLRPSLKDLVQRMGIAGNRLPEGEL